MRPFLLIFKHCKIRKMLQGFQVSFEHFKRDFYDVPLLTFLSNSNSSWEKTKGTKNCYSKGLQNKQLPPNGSRSHPSIPLTLPPQSLSSLRASISQLFYLPTIKSKASCRLENVLFFVLLKTELNVLHLLSGLAGLDGWLESRVTWKNNKWLGYNHETSKGFLMATLSLPRIEMSFLLLWTDVVVTWQDKRSFLQTLLIHMQV